jgi:hypothetical protein
MSCFDKSMYDSRLERELDDYLSNLDYYESREHCPHCEAFSLPDEMETNPDTGEKQCPACGKWFDPD